MERLRVVHKLVSCFMAVILAVGAAACGAESSTKASKPKERKPKKFSIYLAGSKITGKYAAVIRGKRVKVRYKPATKGATVKYRTSNRKVFTVNKKGVLKGKKMGAATLQVSVRSAGKTRKKKVKVFVVNMIRQKFNLKKIELAGAAGSATAAAAKSGGTGTKQNYALLNNGRKMPVFGLGTWTLDNETTEKSVYTALKCGYRLIDTARYYGNEKGVGRGVQRAIDEGIVTRKDVFVTSKIMPGDFGSPEKAIESSNKALGLGYIDLMLIHQPGSDDKKVYRAMEKAVKKGTVRSIGISNYYTKAEFDEVLSYARIAPAVIQNENHPYYQNTKLRKYVSRYGTHVESWYPLGGRGNTKELLGNSTIKGIAEKRGITAAQAIIRWHIQAGYIVIPGSSDPDHIRENIETLGHKLTAGDMVKFRKLNKNERFENW